MKYYDTIEDGEATPLHDGRYSADSTTAAAPRTKKPTSSTFVRAVMVGTTTVGALLFLMAGPSMMMTMNSPNNIDGMVVVSSSANPFHTDCAPATGTFSGLSCKDSNGYCAGPGRSWGGYAKIDDFETCYVSNNDPPNDRCWSRSHSVTKRFEYIPYTEYLRCDPDGYNDGNTGYDKEGIWHVQTPLADGSCGNPCRKFDD